MGPKKIPICQSKHPQNLKISHIFIHSLPILQESNGRTAYSHSKSQTTPDQTKLFLDFLLTFSGSFRALSEHAQEGEQGTDELGANTVLKQTN